MNQPVSSVLLLQKRLPRPLVAMALTGLLLAGTSSPAQSVIAPPPTIANIPRALPQPLPTDSAPSSFLGASPLQFEWLTLRPHFFYRYLYGDGLQATRGNQTSTSIQNISPGVLFNLGNHWNLDYTPTKTFYSDPAFRDTLDHNVSLVGGAIMNDWTANFSQTFTSASPTLIETGRQTKEKLYVTLASVAHNFGNRTQIDGTFNHQTRISDGFNDSKDTSVGGRFHYQFTKRIDASANLIVGYSDVQTGANMTFTRPTAQVAWKASDKLNVNAQAGFENRKFHNGGRDDLNTETFDFALQYQVLPTTGISVTSTRGVQASYFDNLVTKNTGWTVSVQQRLLQRFFLNLSYSNQQSSYVATNTNAAPSRSDRNTTFQARVTTTLIQRLTATAFYQNTRNTTNSSGFGFNSSQIGLELGYAF